MTRVIRYVLIFLIVYVSGCATKPVEPPTSNDTALGSVLLFEEKRQNEPEGVVRMLVTDRYLRIDSGKEEDDFLLYDRLGQLIYNVVVDDETIMQIDNRAVNVGISRDLNWVVEEEKSHAVMGRDGEKQSQYHRYLINGQNCRSVVSVPKLLPDALEALKEYRRALAKELAKGLQYQQTQDTCYLAINILEPARHLENGFPIREWDESGYQRFLQDYQLGISIPERLFDLPAKFNRYSLK